MTVPRATKILIPLGGDINKANLLRSLQLSSSTIDSKVVLLHVIPLPQTVSIEETAIGSLKEETEQKFTAVMLWLTEQGISAELKIAGARSVVEGIVEEAESGEYQLIMIQKTKKRGLSKIANIFKRSTSERLLNLTSTPLLILPP